MSYAQLVSLLRRGFGLSREQRSEFIILFRERRRYLRLLGDARQLKSMRRDLNLLRRRKAGERPAKEQPTSLERTLG